MTTIRFGERITPPPARAPWDVREMLMDIEAMGYRVQRDMLGATITDSLSGQSAELCHQELAALLAAYTREAGGKPCQAQERWIDSAMSRLLGIPSGPVAELERDPVSGEPVWEY